MGKSGSNSEIEVVSNYFAEGKPGMDESISDFQEPKHSNRGPKTVDQKTSKITRKKKKVIKGQKDIRAILKHNKNELVEYSKEFDKVCKKSGLDVDSEQLQLAIALSKSLQNCESVVESSSSSTEYLKSNERIGKIRTTLQEYGFKVPETKIIKKKSLREFKKHSKLFLITDAERKQSITDRYSQIIFQNISDNKSSINDSDKSNQFIQNVPLYELATNIPFGFIKSNAVFYVEKLIEISPNSVGSLLRDWSHIPGRPLSPILKKLPCVEFSDLTLEMEELDVILSGSLKMAQDVINKHNTLIRKDDITHNQVEETFDLSNSPVEIIEVDTNCEVSKIVSIPSRVVRCASPDLFDDELSSIIDNTKENGLLSQQSSQNDVASQPYSQISLSNVTRKKSNDFMDLTKCVNISSQPLTSKIENVKLVIDNYETNKTNVCTNSQNSESTAFSKQNSDDFMEITGCVNEAKLENEYNIDLTQSPDSKGEETIICIAIKETAIKPIEIDMLDLTQSSNSNDDTLPFVKISGKSQKISSPVISLNTDDSDQLSLLDSDKCVNNAVEKINSKECNIFDEYVFAHSPENNLVNIEVTNEPNLIQNSASTEKSVCKSINLEGDNDDLGKIDDVSIDYDEICRDESRTDPNSPCTEENNSKNLSLLTKDPSEKCMMVFQNFTNLVGDENVEKYLSIEQSTTNMVSAPPSEIFEISDEELNYSIHKSKHLDSNSQESDNGFYEIPKDNFDFGGISILDDISTNLQVSAQINNITNNKNTRTSDSSLPDVEIRGTKFKTKPSDGIQLTPVKKLVNDKLCDVQTPSNREYIVKTNQVTPMLDYESMSTPDRNKELHKYGLKPFKRKRAIQLLTHLYNQTHPLVEMCDKDQPSPSKKRKDNSPKKNCPSISLIPEDLGPSPKKCKAKSPRKFHAKSPNELMGATSSKDIEKENVVYDESPVIPLLKEIHCSPEDWVFQKREKAKIHSCRVPLHIAFHNYVTCRRGFREAILRYEPVNIDVIHKDLVGYGYRYDPKDLLRFLDKKCITVKTVDNNTRNMKKYQK